MWVDKDTPEIISSDQKSVPVLLSQHIPNHERQAALAAQTLGESVFDGMEAVTFGLAKRGVVKTYSMIEGCAKELGCTVILRVSHLLHVCSSLAHILSSSYLFTF